jgi:hypothetical protein
VENLPLRTDILAERWRAKLVIERLLARNEWKFAGVLYVHGTRLHRYQPRRVIPTPACGSAVPVAQYYRKPAE